MRAGRIFLHNQNGSPILINVIVYKRNIVLLPIINSVRFIGFLIDFISGPVSAGFTSAAAIVIATSQLKDLLGINIKANSFIGFWDQLAMHIREISVGDGTLGITCMIVLLLLRVSS